MTQDGRCRVYHKTDAKCLDHDDSSTQTHKMYTDVPSHVRIITKNVVYSYMSSCYIGNAVVADVVEVK